MSVSYASTLLQRGMGVQDVAILSGCRPDLVRAMRPRRQEYSYYPRGGVYGPPAPTRKQQIDATINVIAIKHGVTLRDLLGSDTRRIFVHPRQEAMYVIREKWQYSLPRIGRIMGGRHHTTVLHGYRRHKARLAAEGRV